MAIVSIIVKTDHVTDVIVLYIDLDYCNSYTMPKWNML